MARIVAIVDDETAAGFRLAGIDAIVAAGPEDLQREAEGLARGREAAMVILDEDLFRRLPEPVQRRLEESRLPVFLPVPSARRAARALAPEEYLARVMRRAVGYQIRVRR